LDANGYLKITDRVKDLIKSGGEWISSVDMENEIMAYPEVLEATVIGPQHPKWEERPIAVVVLREDHKDVYLYSSET
jgi:acyl-CoA synthetase (AMP-forming)/AMP-acid ligase II